MFYQGIGSRIFVLALLVLFVGCFHASDNSVSSSNRPSLDKASPAREFRAAPQVETNIRFTEVADASGINWTVQNGEEAGRLTILETLGAGCATTDYDRDGRLDILVMGGGRFGGERELVSAPMALFRQWDSWRFTAVHDPSGLPTPKFYNHGAYTADMDNDGFPDLLITGYGGLQLFHNRGDGTFVDVTQASGLVDSLWSTAVGWADLNHDGALDLFVGHYVNWSFDNDPECRLPVSGIRSVCPPTTFAGQPCSAFLSHGDGTFRDASHELGLDLDGKALGVVIADMDGTGELEIYVANDAEPNQFYQREQDGRYSDMAMASGVALGDFGGADGSMGLDVGDFDGDGRLDFWVANFEDQSFAFYRNLGNQLFAHSSRAWGVTSVGRLAVGFGTVIFDADADGYPDIFCANGHVNTERPIDDRKQLPFLFANDRGKRFHNVAAAAGRYLNEKHLGRGVACADLDQNGTLDLVITHNNDPTAVLRNDTPVVNWLSIRLIGRQSCRDAIGSRVTVYCGTKQQVMIVKGGGSYLSTSDLALYFGLGDCTVVDRIEIHWPRGRKTTIDGVHSQQSLLLVEDEEELTKKK